MALILASGSPRRAKILRSLGVDFTVVKTDADEVSYPGDPERTVRENAAAKGQALGDAPSASRRATDDILSADTIVWMDGKIYGKPRDLDEARRFLRELSGRTHRVFTGVAFNGDTKVCTSDVTLRRLTDAQIDEYVRRVNPTDRAGAYDIDEHGELLVERWTGSYENIMGLPTAPLAEWGIAEKTLLHTCCGPCASACVRRLAEAGRVVTMFFSNSNIDTREEFERRKDAAARLAAADGIPFICDDYDHEDWLRNVAAGFENEPEKGARCLRCFRYSLARTAKYAHAHGFSAFTTSLTVSPHKPSALVFSASDDPLFAKFDFKKGDGFKLSVARSAALGLYRQKYCGCEFSRKRTPPNTPHPNGTAD